MQTSLQDFSFILFFCMSFGPIEMIIILFAGLQDIDYALWTGDIPAHNIWNQSRSDQVQFTACYKYSHIKGWRMVKCETR